VVARELSKAILPFRPGKASIVGLDAPCSVHSLISSLIAPSRSPWGISDQIPVFRMRTSGRRDAGSLRRGRARMGQGRVIPRMRRPDRRVARPKHWHERRTSPTQTVAAREGTTGRRVHASCVLASTPRRRRKSNAGRRAQRRRGRDVPQALRQVTGDLRWLCQARREAPPDARRRRGAPVPWRSVSGRAGCVG
jgi:hypothetical protein